VSAGPPAGGVPPVNGTPTVRDGSPVLAGTPVRDGPEPVLAGTPVRDGSPVSGGRPVRGGPEPGDADAASIPADPAERWDPNLVSGDLGGFELLRPFNRAGVLAAADVHAAVRLCRLGGENDGAVALAVALAVRGPRVGHVSVDLTEVSTSAMGSDDEADLGGLPWPDARSWTGSVAASPLVHLDPEDPPLATSASGDPRPLVLYGSNLYLERYWRDEVAVAREILARCRPGPDAGVDREARLERLFPGPHSTDQLAAARLAMAGSLTVIAGGPGTGKTTTVARLLALIFEEAEQQGRRPPLVGLSAPTGKAAARMEDAVRAEAARIDSSPLVAAHLAQVSGSTLHRLLGTRFDRPGRFRHHSDHRLPHEVVVVDEASMVSLSMMASLAQAVRPDARLIVVGDPEQLVSVEAGAVLADIVGPPRAATPPAVPAGPEGGAAPAGAGARSLAGSIVILRKNHRFAGSLARLSEAVRSGDAGATLDVLAAGDPAVSWTSAEPTELLANSVGSSASTAVRDEIVGWAEGVHAAARAGDVAGVITGLRRRRVLCAHRRGPAGVGAWNEIIAGWLDGLPAAVDRRSWYPGRPVMVSANDYGLRLYNGDVGVALVVARTGPQGDGSRLMVAFDEGPDRPPRLISPSRINSAETVYAMTVHKSQGSEFDRITLLLPPAGSRLLTRELIYTALTRARQGVSVVGTEEAVIEAVQRPIARASGLGRRLWASPEREGPGP
jgi:exodeoxyribonuclease V alpha subunit